jgi:hypothetical protein
MKTITIPQEIVDTLLCQTIQFHKLSNEDFTLLQEFISSIQGKELIVTPMNGSIVARLLNTIYYNMEKISGKIDRENFLIRDAQGLKREFISEQDLDSVFVQKDLKGVYTVNLDFLGLDDYNRRRAEKDVYLSGDVVYSIYWSILSKLKDVMAFFNGYLTRKELLSFPSLPFEDFFYGKSISKEMLKVLQENVDNLNYNSKYFQDSSMEVSSDNYLQDGIRSEKDFKEMLENLYWAYFGVENREENGLMWARWDELEVAENQIDLFAL